ncbi:carbohydrate ABC transporter permease [Microbacterium sp. F51-2R]|uniref:carbohydrate ABC transporter permease n=1 Tax=Microbacterium sp. F51-2R TaxID=3445777 RepID=UPI003FA04C08
MNRYTWRVGAAEIVLIVAAVLFSIPLVVLVSIALRSNADNDAPFSWPANGWTLENFADAWTQANLASAVLNSVFVTGGSVLLLIALSALASYPLARVTRRWSRATFAFFMMGLAVPFQLGLIPLYAAIRDVGLLGSPLALIIFYTGLQLPFSVFLYTQFLRELPEDFEEAAQLDGASSFRAFWSIVFPLMLPITGTIGILNIILVWNEFFVPLLFLSGTSNQTIPVALYSFVGQYGSDWNVIFAGLLMGIAPILLLFLLMQRRVFRSFAGGLKG